MTDALENIFVNLKHALVGIFPEPIQWLVSILLSITPLLMIFPMMFALTTVIERKGLGRIQNRLGPNRVGPFGFLQFAADGLKMLTKEDIIPRTADQIVHFLAPVVLLIPTLLAFSVIPYGRNLVPLDLDAGVLFFFAIGASTEVAIFMAGWASRNKYSLLGAMRAIAQMISYEIPLVLSAVSVIMITGSLSLVDIVDGQQGYLWGVIPQWHALTPWGFAGLMIFLIAGLAESNRSPFDIPEAESEIIAGHLTEYSGFKYALFFLAEYLGLFAISGLAVTLFLGGWRAPVAFLEWIPSYIWFFTKLSLVIALFIWIRGTLPRLRTDQLMNFAWKFLLPLSLINLVVAAIWHFTGFWQFPGALPVRWLIAATLVFVPYATLGRGLTAHKKIGPREYHYAE